MGGLRNVVRWAWRWVAVVIVLSSAAYLFAHVSAPEDQVFLGFLANNDDNQLYLSYMREGGQGAWLTTIRFTPEEHAPALLLPIYQILGKIARTLGLSNELTFHLARLIGGVMLLATVWWFSTLCLPDGLPRQSAFLLACFSSGMGWILVITRLADTVIMPVDIRVPESSTFLTIFTSPHFVLGVTFELLTFIFFLGAGKRRWYLLGAGISLLLLSVTLVYNVIVVAVALAGTVLIRCWRRKRVWIPDLWRAIAIGALSAPVIVYYYLILRFDPFWSIAYGEHDVVRSPPLLALLLGYGLVFWLAVWGMALWVRRRQWTPPRILLAVWVVSNGTLLYAPLAFQGKLAAGWHVGLCLTAAVGLHDGLLPWLRGQRWFGNLATHSYRLSTTTRNVVLILTIPSTLLVALIGFRVAAAEHYFPYYLPVQDVRAVAWLEAHAGAHDVVLSSYAIGNYVVAHTDARSFLGHQFAVIDPQGKDRAMRRFFSGTSTEDVQRALVRDHGITFVFCGTHERALGSLDLGSMDWLVPVYVKGPIAVYRVRETEDR
ncbi:MAG: hypothetical protein ISS56_12715 [Anaerolineae bacterium]|nr:hypothetical protein [Anaerolineae bacterium]